jgi:hypothetical protein
MDINRFLSNIQSLGGRIRDWLERNGVRITIHYQINGVPHDAVIVGDVDRAEHPPNPPVEPVEVTPLGAVAIVGASALAVGALILNPGIVEGVSEGSIPSNHGLTDSEILSNCAEIDTMTPSSGSQKEPENCSICMENFVEKQTILILPCLHKFHKDCIVPWLRQTGLCSICRNPVNSLPPS